MGNTCKPMAVSFKCMTKSTTNTKKKKKKKEIAQYIFTLYMYLCNYHSDRGYLGKGSLGPLQTDHLYSNF